jgi:hypothetical protein
VNSSPLLHAADFVLTNCPQALVIGGCVRNARSLLSLPRFRRRKSNALPVRKNEPLMMVNFGETNSVIPAQESKYILGQQPFRTAALLLC